MIETILWIASMACSQNNFGPFCFTELDAPIVYAYDNVSNHAARINRESGHVIIYTPEGEFSYFIND